MANFFDNLIKNEHIDIPDFVIKEEIEDEVLSDPADLPHLSNINEGRIEPGFTFVDCVIKKEAEDEVISSPSNGNQGWQGCKKKGSNTPIMDVYPVLFADCVIKEEIGDEVVAHQKDLSQESLNTSFTFTDAVDNHDSSIENAYRDIKSSDSVQSDDSTQHLHKVPENLLHKSLQQKLDKNSPTFCNTEVSAGSESMFANELQTQNTQTPSHNSTKQVLTLHTPTATQSLTHSGVKQFFCKQCGQGFTQKSNLTSHMLLHSGEKPYSCDQCNKCFTQSSSLTKHMVTHSGVKQFSCAQCNKCFTQSSSLTKHMLIHSEVKQFSCVECKKCFTQKGNLTSHMLTHSVIKPFSCTQCNKCFTQKSNLTSHMLTHSGVKQFSCTQCSQSFTLKQHLTRHMLTHSGIKPFTCTKCGKSFTQKSNLKTHMCLGIILHR